jgi:dsRNA-specific ribonuclease
MLRLNRGAQVPPPKSKTIADALEAVIGAAYLDGGFEAARTIFENLRLAEKAAESGWSSNPKGELQVRTQALTPLAVRNTRLSGSTARPTSRFSR